jgi:acetate kinase
MAGMILVANPGSSSRKYALYDANLALKAQLHFEIADDALVCTLHGPDESHQIQLDFEKLSEAASHVERLFKSSGVLGESETISSVGLRIVAPSSYFMQDHIITDEVVDKLQALYDFAPIHIDATLTELRHLKEQFSQMTIVGVSDSAFHATKPNYAWNYGIDIHDSDRLDIKRFGYHGLSISASVDMLWDAGKLPPKVIICHLGSGSSVTGVYHGRSIDTTMGYTPLEGVVMATRSGSIDAGAVRALKRELSMDDEQLEDYLHTKGGLMGLAGSNDIRELLDRETGGDHMAHLALTTLVHSYHKAIGAMMVALNGCDLLVFTGTVGERSAVLRKRVVAHLEFHDFILDGNLNEQCTSPQKLTAINQAAKSRPIFVVPANESLEIAKHVRNVMKQVQ